MQRHKPIPQEAAHLSNYVFGKVQPQAVPLEEAVLGALMLDKGAYRIIEGFLRPEHFYVEAHKAIFGAIKALFDKTLPVDLLTVMEELRKADKLEAVGGPAYLAELTNRVGSAANIEYHARIVLQKWINRAMIEVSTVGIRKAFEDVEDPIQMLEEYATSIAQIQRGLYGKEVSSFSGAVMERAKAVMEVAQKRHNGEPVTTGVPSGFRDLDMRTGCAAKGDLIITAGRPGMGKTGFMLSKALRQAKMGMAVGIFSLEMTEAQLIDRATSIEGQIPLAVIKNGAFRLDGDSGPGYRLSDYLAAIDRLSQLPIYIDDTPSLPISEFRIKARLMKMLYDIEYCYVDYLQLMTVSNPSPIREQVVGEISRCLKATAKELDLPVEALAQLSRAVETRGGAKIPQLSDLRESGSVEQDANRVDFIYRPEYYHILEDEEGNSLVGVVEIHTAKNRDGALDKTKLTFKGQYTEFDDYNGMLEAEVVENPQQQDEMPKPPAAMHIITRPSRMNDDEDIPF